MDTVIFEAKHMRKTFGPTVALKDVDFSLKRGEIRGLIGENGSGKSTIMSIASGMQSQTSGEMFYMGQPWKPHSMVEAQEAGISMILQEANTIPNLTVAHNIFAGHEKDFTVHGIFNNRKMVKAAQELLDKFGIQHIKAKDSINKYSFEDRKLVELVRCVTDKTEILVVDETTTALSLEGRDILYKVIHELANNNKAVVFISHDMDEIFEQCTVLTVLRDGDIIGNIEADELKCKDETKKKELVKRVRQMMVGRDIGEKYYREDFTPSAMEDVALEVNDISFRQIKHFSLTAKRGEIVGIGGLSGCGMHDVGRAIFGLEKLDSGSVVRNGQKITSPLSAIRQGIGYISKNRDTEALIVNGSIAENITLPSLDALSHFTFINPKDEKKLIDGQIKSLSIKCASPQAYISSLSGGNKQKVSFAKWMAKGSDLVVMDCPTRGVDVGVKQAMYAIMEEMKAQGKTIIMISEELSELIGMADRVIIMKSFQIMKEFERSAELNALQLVEYMI